MTVTTLCPDVLDLDRLLWVPGQKTIFLPPAPTIVRAGGANTLLTIDMVAREALMVLENNLLFTKMVNRSYDAQFGAKVGSKIQFPTPMRYR